jgi:ATP-dependent exoDNAse (exonuclease V) beta subunit
VGDVKQSIYRWRNGDWRILLQQVEQQVVAAFHLSEESEKQFIKNDTLETNFRSLPRIVAFNNYIYEHIPVLMQRLLNDKVQTELSEENYGWWQQEHNDNMLVRAYENSKQMVPDHKLKNEEAQGSVEITYFPVEDGRYRANHVMAHAIANLCHKVGEWISSGRYEAKQIGILVRSNRQALYVIEQLMVYKNREGLQFEVISGDVLALASNDAVGLLIETLRAIVYTSDLHTIHHARMAYLYQRLQQRLPFEPDVWLLFKANDMHQLGEILPRELTENWEFLRTLPLLHLVEKLIEIYGLGAKGQPHLPYILAFKDMVDSFMAKGERGINQFLTFWEEDGNKAVLPSNGKVNAIEVTTIHKSKGLAYDVVMLPFCSWTVDGMVNGDFWVHTEGTPFAQLGKIPLKYNGNLANSIFYKQYYEEMLFNYMDALNTMYVATTRAVEHLYISAPAFKEIVDKKSGIVTGLDIKNELISDLLFQVLDMEEAPFRLEEGKLAIDQPRSPKGEVGDRSLDQTLSLESYPLSKALESAWNKPSSRNMNTILMMDKAAQYGVLAHEVMAEIRQQSDIAKIVARYIDEGILAKENKDTLLSEIEQIWNHPQIHRWLTGDYTIRNEAAIIMADGTTIRPDKVFSNAHETIVLDFKFTSDNYVAHKTQVDRYIQALQNLGSPAVRGYLYYAKGNELVEVR